MIITGYMGNRLGKHEGMTISINIELTAQVLRFTEQSLSA
jgi:hypothetical protein